MKKGMSDKKRISQYDWIPFWWGSKFIRRLSAKRERRFDKREQKKREEDTE